MVFVIFACVMTYILWTITNENHNGCECRDCEHCPFTRCKEREK